MKTRMATTKIAALGVLSGGLALAGCGDRQDAHIARNDVSAGAGVEHGRRAQDVATRDDSQLAREAADAARRTDDQVKESAQTAADQATDKVSDAMITTAINTEFAKDPALSAMPIDVDTDAGRVALHGTAHDEQARARAEQLASQVPGVVSVDNHIAVQRKG